MEHSPPDLQYGSRYVVTDDGKRTILLWSISCQMFTIQVSHIPTSDGSEVRVGDVLWPNRSLGYNTGPSSRSRAELTDICMK